MLISESRNSFDCVPDRQTVGGGCFVINILRIIQLFFAFYMVSGKNARIMKFPDSFRVYGEMMKTTSEVKFGTLTE